MRRLKHISLFCGLLLSAISWAQPDEAALQQAVEQAATEEEKVDALYEIAWALKVSNATAAKGYAKEGLDLAMQINYGQGLIKMHKCLGVIHLIQGDYDVAEGHFVQSMDKSEEQNDQEGKSEALRSLGSVNYLRSNYKKAIDFYNQSLAIKEETGDKEGAAKALNNIGICYKKLGNLTMSMESYIKAIKIYDELNDPQGKANAYTNIGIINSDMGNIEQGLENYKKALAEYEKAGSKVGKATTYNNIGIAHFDMKDYSKALEAYGQALIENEDIGEKKLIANVRQNMGETYAAMGDDEEALRYYLDALAIKEEIGDKQGLASGFHQIGVLYSGQGNEKIAVAYLERSVALAREIGSKDDIRKASEALSKAHAKLGQFKEAFLFHRECVAAKDSILNEESSKLLVEMQEKYETEKRDMELARREAELKQQQTQKYAVLAGLGMVVLLLISIVWAFLAKQRTNRLLAAQKERIEQQHELLKKKNRLITDSIDYAKRIQDALLTKKEQVQKHFPESFVFLKPKDVVSGDFFWLHETDEVLLFAAVDCTGHGVPGAFMSIVGHDLLEKAVKLAKLTNPAEILDNVNRYLAKTLKQKSEEGLRDGMDIALCALNKKTNELTYAGANNPIYLVKGEAIEEIKPNKISIGSQVEEKFEYHTVQLEKGDAVHLFTDGFADQKGGPKKKKFYYEPFKELLLGLKQKKLNDYTEELEKTLINWMGNHEQMDDVLVMGVKV